MTAPTAMPEIPINQPKPAPPTPEQLRREFVAGGAPYWFGTQARSLPWAIDDLEAAFGIDLYERMRLDPQVDANLTVLWASIIEDGFTFTAAVSDQSDPQYELAQQIADEARAMYKRLPIDNILYDQLAAIWSGYSVAEVTYAPTTGVSGASLLTVSAIKVKPPWATAFVVDAFFNIVGLIALLPGKNNIIAAGAAVNPAETDLLPREKFCILSFRPRYNDPRGTSILRSVFEPWNDKRQLTPEYRAYLSQFANPSLAGMTPDNAQAAEVVNPDGSTSILTPEEAMKESLIAFRNGTVAAFPAGTKLQPIEMQGDGSPFLRAFARADQQITKAVLTAALATEEGEHQARAAAGVHQDVQDTIVRQGKRFLCRAHQMDVLEQWVVLNWGEAARRLTPVPTLGVTEQHDMGPMMTGIAELKKSDYFYSQEQLQQTDSLLGLPERDLSVPSDIDGPPAPAVPVPPQLVAATPPAPTPSGAA